MPEINIPDRLSHDCNECMGLCCMAHVHRPQDGFPILQNKPAGVPCENLVTQADDERGLYKCKIHDALAANGWQTCAEFTCYGAGQTVSKLFKELGVSWAEDPSEADTAKRKVQVLNLRYGYQALNEVLRLLFGIGHEFDDEVYQAAREAIIGESQDFATALARTDKVIDPNYWVRGRFDVATGNAVRRVLSSRNQTAALPDASVVKRGRFMNFISKLANLFGSKKG